MSTSTRTSDLRDAAGVVHTPAGEHPRIVCLVPSITELICDLGLAEHLVGRTGFCIHPWDTVRPIPKVGGTKELRWNLIRHLAPTHVIVNIDENRREDAERLAKFVPNVIVTHPQGPEDNLALYRLLGGIFDRPQQAELLCAAFTAELEQLKGRATAAEQVLYLIWREPWMTVSADTYISRTLKLINWTTLPQDSDDRYPEVMLEEFRGSADRVLLSSEPYHFKEHHIPEIKALLPAARVELIDGEMTSWYGSRAIQGLRYLQSLV